MQTRIKSNITHKKNGKLSMYGFYCGYIEQFEGNKHDYIKLNLDNLIWCIHGKINNIIINDSIDRLDNKNNIRQARQLFHQYIRQINNINNKQINKGII